MGFTHKLLACGSLRDEALHVLDSPELSGTCDCVWLPMELHEDPAALRACLRDNIAACAGGGFDAVLLLFGLCGRATAGLSAPPDTRLVIPRAHDCIALQLGSADRHRREQEEEAGTFWFGRGYLRNASGETDLRRLGAGSVAPGGRPDPETLGRSLAAVHGEEAAAYLVKTLMEEWKGNYTRAVHLSWPENPHDRDDERRVGEFAREGGWRFESRAVDLRLIRMLLAGDWPEEEFAVVMPGGRLEASHDSGVFRVDVQSGVLTGLLQTDD